MVTPAEQALGLDPEAMLINNNHVGNLHVEVVAKLTGGRYITSRSPRITFTLGQSNRPSLLPFNSNWIPLDLL